MNKILFSILLMHAFSQMMEQIDVCNGIQKKSNADGNSITYAYFFNGIGKNRQGVEVYINGDIKKKCVKQKDTYSLSFYDDYKDKWHPIDANPLILAQGFACLENLFKGQPKEKLPDIFLINTINKSDAN